ncbi:MAG TPA: hypothetical protein VHD33_00420, partial [Legionellaceae bacterium]|nr:hypothetical protein [Legionellaceae bacterium]
MHDLKELESIQQSFNLLVEHARGLMQELYDYAVAKGQHPVACGAHNTFYTPRLPALAIKYRSLLKLINANISNDLLTDNDLCTYLWGCLRTEHTHRTYQGVEGFDERYFIISLSLGLHQY